VIDIVRKVLKMECVERRVSLSEFHAADEVFTTGTMGELTPVSVIDGRCIGKGEGGERWPITRRIQEAYRELTEREGTVLP
jgi:branched-subunit amino acid aminotransferase/4-amino-4-deoxychorismate lyase